MRAGAQFSPARPQLAQDSPEKLAVHEPRNAAARSGSERERLGILEVVCDLMQERVEQLLDRAGARRRDRESKFAPGDASGSNPRARAGWGAN